jgi:hypothetical protein
MQIFVVNVVMGFKNRCSRIRNKYVQFRSKQKYKKVTFVRHKVGNEKHFLNCRHKSDLLMFTNIITQLKQDLKAEVLVFLNYR